MPPELEALKGPLELIALVAVALLWPPRTYFRMFRMRRRARPGEVIRMYKLREKHMIGASARHPAWFYVTGVGEDDLVARVLQISQPGIEDPELITPGEEWSIGDSHKTRQQFGDGRYHIIRPERWPDDISAAVMVLKLQGVID